MPSPVVIIGVTGSIAAYKAADLTSKLAKAGCDVHVVMTADALRFITPLAFKTLSRHPVVTDLYDGLGGSFRAGEPSYDVLARRR